MTTIDLPLGATAPAAAAVAAPPLALSAYADLAAVEEVWRAFEATASGTPYQRYDWVRSAVETIGRAEGLAPRVVVGRDAGGEVALLLPLALRKVGPLTVAGPVGDKHANFHAALWRAGAPLGDARALLEAAGRLVGADAVALPYAPRRWNGAPNPLVPASAPTSGNLAYRLRLEAEPEATLLRALSRDTRKRMRQKENRLRELGPVSLRRARTPDEVEKVLRAFLAQKAERRRTSGLPNPFEDGPTREFLRSACLAGLERGAPAIELYALHAGERIVATFGGAADGARLSGMVNAFEAGDPEVNRRSPGDILLTHLIAEQCRAGRAVFDLGVGAALYKERFCDETEELAEILVPVTALGHAYAAAARLRARARDAVKRTPWLWSLVLRLRRRQAALEG